jgi:hypothetical protein
VTRGVAICTDCVAITASADPSSQRWVCCDAYRGSAACARRLALSYVVPIIAALFIFDGVISGLRTCSQEAPREMTGLLYNSDSTYEIERTSHRISPAS